MTSPIPKIKEDQPLDEFEFLDVDDDLEYYKEPTKSPISDSVKKIGSGVSLIFSALCTISEEQGFVVKLPVKSIATTAVSTLTGTLIGGVPGMAVGKSRNNILHVTDVFDTGSFGLETRFPTLETLEEPLLLAQIIRKTVIPD
ncbi:hypothetical protein RUM43_011188 [Polyplax serrata]|uniref:Uncharacterized protein n=1 Tax=Polyplax serrata TaxID=468196 RepID=A0AAN8NLQ0_POLSC